jgi:hypothetical protein
MYLIKALLHVPHVRGEKSAMIAHILGSRGRVKKACTHASQAAKEIAQKLRDVEARKKKRLHDDEEDVEGVQPSAKRPNLTQLELKVYNGVNMPIPADLQEAFKKQAVKAILSTGSPWRLFEDPKMKTLFRMMRAKSADALPSRKVACGRLLDDLAEGVEGKIQRAFKNKEVGIL